MSERKPSRCPWCNGDHIGCCPSPDEIEQRCREIRSSWSWRERVERQRYVQDFWSEPGKRRDSSSRASSGCGPRLLP